MQRLKIIKGDDRRYDIIFSKDGEVMDITDFTLFFTVKSNVKLGDDLAEIKKEVTEHDDPLIGATSLTINAEDTQELEAGKYYFDFQLKSPDGKIGSTLMGEFYILQDVTERTNVTD